MSGLDPNAGGALVVPGSGGATLSDATPAALGTAAAGVSTSASRADHVHAAPAAGGTYGSGTLAARPASPAAGDTYAVTSGVAAGDRYACFVAGAWALLAAGATAADARAAIAAAYDPGARAIDVNHVYAWRCDDAAGAGTVAAGAGGVAMTLTGSTWVQGDGGLYRGGRALHLTAGAAGADSAVSGAITPPAGSMSVELDFLLSIPNGIAFGASQTMLFGLNNGAGGNYLYLRLSWSAGASGFQAGWKPNASAEQATSIGALPGSSVPPGVPHHALLTITKGSGSSNGTMSLYLDGTLVHTATGIYDAGLAGGGGTWVATLASPVNTVAPLMRVGEVLISDTARDAAYARAAYATLRART